MTDVATPSRHAVGRAVAGLPATAIVIAYLVLLVVLPARLVLPGMGGAGRPAVVAGLVMLVWWLLAHLHPSTTPRGRQPVRWLLLLLVVAVLASYVVAFDRGVLPLEGRSADRYLIGLGSWLGVALIVADGLRDRRCVDRVLQVLVGLTAVSAFVGCLQFYGLDLTPYVRLPGLVYNQELVGLGQRGGPDFNRVYGTQQHYIEFGVVLAMVLPLAIHRALISVSRRQARARWFAVAVIAAAIPFSISRAGFLGLVAGFLVLSAAWPRGLRLRAYLAAIGALVVFRGAVPGVLGTIKSAFLNFENDPSIINRRADYAATSSYIADRPWFGRGPGTFVPEHYRVLDNQYLGSLLEVGVFGTAALALIFLGGYLLARSVRRRAADQRDAHLGQALAATFVVAIVASFTFDSLSFPTFAGLLFLCVGLAGTAFRLRDEPAEAPSTGRLLVQPPWLAGDRTSRGPEQGHRSGG